MQAFMRLIAVSGLLVALCSGCNSKVDSPSGGQAVDHSVGAVAIIDLDAIAKQLGCDKEMGVSIQQREASLNQQLALVKETYSKQISEKQQELGANLTQEQAQQLAGIQRQMNANLNQARQRAKNDLTQHSARLIQSFRNNIKPVARQVASEKGLSIIVTKNDSVIFDYDRAVDITDAVVQRMLARQPSRTAAAETRPAQDTPAVANRPTRDRAKY